MPPYSSLELEQIRAARAALYDLSAVPLSEPSGVGDWGEPTGGGEDEEAIPCRTAQVKDDELASELRMERSSLKQLMAAHDCGLVFGRRLRVHGEVWRIVSIREESGPNVEFRAIIAKEVQLAQ